MGLERVEAELEKIRGPAKAAGLLQRGRISDHTDEGAAAFDRPLSEPILPPGAELAMGKGVPRWIHDMLARRQELNTQFYQLVDALVMAFALIAAHTVRFFGTRWFHLPYPIDPFRNYQWLLLILMPFGPIFLDLQGFYRSPLNKTIWKSFVQILRTLVYLSLMVGACVIFLRLPLTSRAVPLLFMLIVTVALLVKERLVVRGIRRRAARGELRERVLLAGVPEDIAALESSLSAEETLLLNITDRIDIEEQPISDLVEAMHRHAVSRVIFAASHGRLDRVEAAIGACEVEGVSAWLVANFIQTSIAKPDFDAFGGRPMLVFRSTPEVSWALAVKRVIDALGAALLIVVFALPMLLVALGIRLTSKGPIIFKQMRAGKYGKPFVMYKFRSMSSDAEMRRAELLPFNQMSGPVFKVDNDPRITPLGRWLRRTSMDELPQFFNVLAGHMSLVGPRPLPIYEVENFEHRAQRRRLSVKPGLTCLWQISGRNQVKDFSDWVKLDLQYIDHWSLGLDFKILLRTVPAVLFGFGAK
jgi:exopolysaccharide biosynthesis polyprenyl glycosylphosphotransferase